MKSANRVAQLAAVLLIAGLGAQTTPADERPGSERAGIRPVAVDGEWWGQARESLYSALAVSSGYEGLRCSATPIDDVNGDGFSDVAAACQIVEVDTARRAYVAVFLGTAGEPHASPAWVADGGFDTDFGRTVGTVDANGDEYADFVVEGQVRELGKEVSGQTLVFFGSFDGPADRPGLIIDWTRTDKSSAQAYPRPSLQDDDAREPVMNIELLADPVDGSYAGITGQGYPMSFVVQSNTIPTFVGKFSCPGFTVEVTVTPGNPIEVNAGTFSWGEANSCLPSADIRFAGTFDTSTSATGEFDIWVQPPGLACCQINNLDWSATAGGGGGGGGGTPECGNAAYDNSISVDAAWFQGGWAGDPDHMMGVRFDLIDFGYTPNDVQITGFCAGNQLDFGGPWPNEVFIYHDDGGRPNDSVILGQGTILTGDGTGPSIVTLPQPVTLQGDFWLMVRGDPMHAGEDFNLEFDGAAGTGHSFISPSGIGGLTERESNFALRAYLQSGGGGGGGGADHVYLVAGVADTTGAQNTVWQTNFAATNLSSSQAQLTLTYNHGGGSTTRSATLGPGVTTEWIRVVQSLFGVPGASSGAVLVESTQPVYITARTFNVGESGTFGQFLPGVKVGSALTLGETGVLNQIKKNSGFRTNIGGVNLSDMTCQSSVRIYGRSGVQAGSQQMLTIGPYGWEQINDILGVAGAGNQDIAYATVEVITPGCEVWPYASVVDALTGDATTSPLLKEDFAR